MTKKERILNNIRIAIQLAGYSGVPFTYEEYNEMNNFLNQLENE